MKGFDICPNVTLDLVYKLNEENKELKRELEYYYKIMDVLQDFPIDIDELLED